MAISAGECYLELRARDGGMIADLKKARAQVIGTTGEMQRRWGGATGGMADISRRDLSLITSQFGAAGSEINRAFFSIINQGSQSAIAGLTSLGGAISVVGVAIAGWKIGEQIGNWLTGLDEIEKKYERQSKKAEQRNKEEKERLKTLRGYAKELTELAGEDIRSEPAIKGWEKLIEKRRIAEGYEIEDMVKIIRAEVKERMTANQRIEADRREGIRRTHTEEEKQRAKAIEQWRTDRAIREGLAEGRFESQKSMEEYLEKMRLETEETVAQKREQVTRILWGLEKDRERENRAAQTETIREHIAGFQAEIEATQERMRAIEVFRPRWVGAEELWRQGMIAGGTTTGETETRKLKEKIIELTKEIAKANEFARQAAEEN